MQAAAMSSKPDPQLNQSMKPSLQMHRSSAAKHSKKTNIADIDRYRIRGLCGEQVADNGNGGVSRALLLSSTPSSALQSPHDRDGSPQNNLASLQDNSESETVPLLNVDGFADCKYCLAIIMSCWFLTPLLSISRFCDTQLSATLG